MVNKMFLIITRFLSKQVLQLFFFSCLLLICLSVPKLYCKIAAALALFNV